MWRFLRRLIEFVAAFAAIVTIVAIGLIWWLNAHPLGTTVLTPYMEEALSGVLPDAQVDIKHSLLTWDNANHALALYADGIEVTDKTGTVIADVSKLDVHFSGFGLLVGRFLPSELTAESPQLRLTREPDGTLTFGGMQAGGSTGGGTSLKETAVRLTDRLRHSPLLRKLLITHGQLMIHDAATQTDWTLGVPDIQLKHDLADLGGHMFLDLGQQAEQNGAALEVFYAYDNRLGRHRLTAQFTRLNPARLAGGHPDSIGLPQAAAIDLPLSGEIAGSFDKHFNLAGVMADIHAGHGTVTLPTLWPQPRGIEKVDFKGSFDAVAKTLDLPTASVDFGGPTFAVAVTGTPSSAPGKDMDFTATAHFANWPMDDFGNLWPLPVIAGARDWMAANMTKGMFDSASAEVKGSLAFDRLADADITAASAKATASHGELSFLDGFPHAKDVNATAIFDLQRATITVTSGTVAGLNVQPFTLAITGLDQPDQAIEIPAHIAGPIPAALQLIDLPPLGYTSAMGIKPGDVTGDMDGVVTLKFPLLNALTFKDIDIAAAIDLTNAATSALVKGIDVTQGSLNLAITKTGLSAKGNAALDKVPLRIDWQENFAPEKNQPVRQATIAGPVNGDQWEAFGIPVAGRIHGPARLTLQLTAPSKNQTILTGSVDLTAPEAVIPELNYAKPANAPTQLSFAATLPQGKDIQLKSIQLRGPQLNAGGSAVLTADGKLKSLDFPTLKVGRTDASVHFDQSPDAGQHFTADGASLDIQGILKDKTPNRTENIPQSFRIKIGKLFTSPDGYLLNAAGSATRDRQGWQTAAFTSSPEGTHTLIVQLAPQPDNSRKLLVTCDDFGATLRVLGFTQALQGGALRIDGASAPDDPAAIIGTATVSAFEVSNLPMLVLLLNATSPLGFTNILSDKVSFDHLRGKFRWEGTKVELINVNASGAAIGITTSGVIDTDNGQGQLHGTLVPFSMVNRALDAIPVLGKILTGGDNGGVIAATYKIHGPLDKPDISVNPVSLLTPGFLRNLFFGGPANEADDKGMDEPEAGTETAP